MRVISAAERFFSAGPNTDLHRRFISLATVSTQQQVWSQSENFTTTLMGHAEWGQAISSRHDSHKCVAVKEGRTKQKQTNNVMDANETTSLPSVLLMCEQMIASSKDQAHPREARQERPDNCVQVYSRLS